MSAQRATVRQLGRGRRPAKETHQSLRKELYAAAKAKRKADQKLKQLEKQARAAGLPVKATRSTPNPDFKVRRRHIHLFPYGLDDLDHNHLVIELSDELSPSCIAELQEKVKNGRVSFDRDRRINGRWRVIKHEDDESTYAAAD